MNDWTLSAQIQKSVTFFSFRVKLLHLINNYKQKWFLCIFPSVFSLVYPADPDYYGRPAVQDFPQFDIVEDTYSTSNVDSRRNSRFGGFPFPLDRCDRRAPLPPCYSNQNLDNFLGPDGLPLPSSQCPNEYTTISYYPNQRTRSLDSNSSGYKRLSVRMNMAMPSHASSPTAPRAAEPQMKPAGQNTRSYDRSSMVESDYGSCEEVMF